MAAKFSTFLALVLLVVRLQAAETEALRVGIYRNSQGLISTHLHPTLIVPKAWMLELLGNDVDWAQYGLSETADWYVDFGTKTGLDGNGSYTDEWIRAHRQKKAVLRIMPSAKGPFYKVFSLPVTDERKRAFLRQLSSWIDPDGIVEARNKSNGGAYIITRLPWRLDPAVLPAGASLGIEVQRIQREAPLAAGESSRNCVMFVVEMLQAAGVLREDQTTLLAYSPGFAFWTGPTLDSMLSKTLEK